MKTTWREVLVGCLLTAMAGCAPNDGGPNGVTVHDGGGSQPRSTDAGMCTSAQVAILGAACSTCIENNCQALIASCTGGSCAQCLVGCTTCASACLERSSSDAGAGGDGAGGVPSSSGSDGGTPSCDRMRKGNCCSYAALANLEAQCQQALDSDNEAICASLMSQTQNFLGFCK